MRPAVAAAEVADMPSLLRRQRPEAPPATRAPASAAHAPHPDELAAVWQAARAVNQTHDLDQALDAILDAAMRLLDAEEGSVQLLDDDREHLRIVAARGLAPEVVASSRTRLGSGVAGQVAATGQAVLLGARIDSQRFSGFVEKNRPIRAAVCVPLRLRQEILGVLNLNVRSDGRSFDERDLRRAGVFAEAVAAAVSAARMYDAAARRGDALARLAVAARRLGGGLDLPELAAKVLDGAEELFDGQGAVLAVLAGDGSYELALYRGVGLATAQRVLSSAEISRVLAADGPLVLAADEGDGQDGGLDPQPRPLATPLLADGRRIGLLVLVPLAPAAAAGPPAPGAEGEATGLLAAFAAQATLALSACLARREARGQNAMLGAIVNAVPDPLLVVDGEGAFLAINPAAAELFSLSADFELGRSVRGRLRSQELEALCLAERHGSTEVRVGGAVQRTMLARAVDVAEAAITGRLVLLEDVTAQREAEQVKADFVAVVGHELRTPMTIIKGYVRTLVRRGDAMTGAARGQALEQVEVQTMRLERLIEDFLFVAGMQGRGPTLKLANEDLVGLVDGVLDGFRGRGLQRVFELRAPAASVPLRCDRTKLEQVVHHLVDNAVKYSDQGMPVTVELADEPGRVRISVTDRGKGIFSGDLPRVFERFQQLDGTSTRSHGGTGIGLYIAKSLVDAHHGTIAARSALGKGSTFTVTLPKELVSTGQGA
jgi:signal transduction histidine kinase